MHDQAQRLRKLIATHDAEPSHGVSASPRVIALLGAVRDVGTTTIARNLASVVSQQIETVLVHIELVDRKEIRATATDAMDADKYRANESNLAWNHEETTPELGDLTIRQCQIRDGRFTRQQVTQLILELNQTYGNKTTVLIDTGSTCSPIADTIWKLVDQAIVVTTIDTLAITETYSLIKTMAGQRTRCQEETGPTHLGLVLNRIGDGESASEPYQRLAKTCRDFLGLRVELYGDLPFDKEITEDRNGLPYALRTPNRPAARSLARMGRPMICSPGASR